MRIPEFHINGAQAGDVFSYDGHDYILIDDLTPGHNPCYCQSVILNDLGKPIIIKGRAQLQIICLYIR